METPLLAAALIVKNEERFLPDCIASLNALRPLLSEICVYDTGSTDRTIEIAREAGARVEEGYWDDDFARARNCSIALCRAKWVMIIDADERVSADLVMLERRLRAALTVGMIGMDVMRSHVANMDAEGRVVSAFPSIRFLRPRRTEYEGRVHERVVGKTHGLDLRILDLDPGVVTWKHLGYALAEAGAKGARNLALADAALSDADESFDVDELAVRLLDRARSHMEAGRVEDALNDYLRCWRLDTRVGQRLWAGQDLGDILVRLGAFEEAAAMARDLHQDGRQPQYADWVMARARLGQSRHGEALELLRRIDSPANTAGFSMGTADVIEARMIAAAQSGETDEALASCIRLMAGHGRIEGRGDLLMALWGGRPQDLLAQLLIETGEVHLGAIADDLAACPAGADQVITELRRALAVRV